jgi:hypothetical protein
MRFLARLLPLCAVAMLLSGLLQAGSSEGAEPLGMNTGDAFATVTFVKGAPMFVEDASTPRPLTKGQTLYAGGAVQTDGVSRIEMALSGGGVIRLAGDAVLELGDGTDTAESGARQRLRLLKGDMWANFSGQHSGGLSQILVAGARISGPRSIFRAVMHGQGDAEIKTYTGQVTASGPFEIKTENNSDSPEANPGDEDSPPEPWRYQIEPYHKMIVLASGEASQPFRFAALSDFTDWVRWNQQRDEREK